MLVKGATGGQDGSRILYLWVSARKTNSSSLAMELCLSCTYPLMSRIVSDRKQINLNKIMIVCCCAWYNSWYITDGLQNGPTPNMQQVIYYINWWEPIYWPRTKLEEFVPNSSQLVATVRLMLYIYIWMTNVLSLAMLCYVHMRCCMINIVSYRTISGWDI